IISADRQALQKCASSACQTEAMTTAGSQENQELMSQGKNLSVQRCAGPKSLPNRRKERANDREHGVSSYRESRSNSTCSMRTEFLVGTGMSRVSFTVASE